MARPILIAHSSDLHIGFDGPGTDSKIAMLDRVLATAAAHHVDLLLLAGDIFDHNRVPLAILDEVQRRLGDFAKPVVILPGNHDPITPESVYRRGGVADPENVHVFGITEGDCAEFAGLDLNIWGRPHEDFGNMIPLDGAPPRKRRFQIAVAHGHWHAGVQDSHRSWLIHDHQVEALDADYLALGHWDRPVRVANGTVPAYYSGSPDLARTINLVRLAEEGLTVTRARIPELGEPYPDEDP